MSDKSFGDHANRNVVKNPLLSTSVVGLSLHDLPSNAVLLPVPVAQSPISSQGRQPPQPAPHPKQSGDGTTNPNTPHKQPQIQQITQQQPPKTDDFDVSEYFARLQGTRYVSAPLNVDTELEKTTLEKAEENLEEINLNEQPIQQSLTSDIAQNFSQLPQVLPQVASAVFSSFSNMLSYKSREATPEVETKMAEHRLPFEGAALGEVFRSPAAYGGPVEMKTEPALPPPRDVLGSTQNTFRITTKKKSYAQIPGLSSGETAPINQYVQPPQPQTSTPFYVPGFEPGQPNPPAMTGHLPGFDFGQTPQPTSFGVSGFQSGQTQTICQVQGLVGKSSQPGPIPGFQPGQTQPPSQTGLYNQGDRVIPAMTSQIQGDFSRRVHESITEKVCSGEPAVTFRTGQDGNENIASNSQDTVKEPERKGAETTPALKHAQATDNTPVENIHAFNPQNFPPANSSQTVQMSTPTQPSSQDTACDNSNPQHSSSFSNVPGLSAPIIPPPTMFSNQRRDSKTEVGKAILPPSIARRLAANQPLTKQPVNQPTFGANIFVPAPAVSQTSQDTSPLGQKSIPPEFSALPMSGANVTQAPHIPLVSNTPTSGQTMPSNFAPSLSVWPTHPSTFAAASTVTPLAQKASAMPPLPMSLNSTPVPEPAKTTPMANTFAPPKAAVNLPPLYNVTATPTQMFDPTVFATNQPDQNMVQNILEPPKPTFDPIAFTTNPPEPPKAVPEPPKISTGNTNFRLSKKRPQYYSGPIDGVGSISNNVKPIIPQTEMPNAYQGALFAPEPVKIPEVPPFETSQAFIPPTMCLEAATVPFDLNKPAETNMGSNLGFNISDQQQSIIHDEINTAFDFSRATTQNFDQPKQESKGFIGSLKSKISALDINKIQNSVTSFFDPAYNEGVKAEPDNYGQGSQNYGQTSESYTPTGQNYVQSGQAYGEQDQQTNLEIFIPNLQQMPEQIFNQQCYDSTYNQCQSTNMNAHGLQSNNKYFPEHYNYYQFPSQNSTDQQSYYSVHPPNSYVQQQTVQTPLTAEQIQENNSANVYNSNVYNFNQMSEDVTSKYFFDNQHHSNVNQYGADEVKNMTKVQADAQVVSDKLLQNQTVGFHGSASLHVSECDPTSLQDGDNVPVGSHIRENTPVGNQVAANISHEDSQESPFVTKQTQKIADFLEDFEVDKEIPSDDPKPVAEVIPAKDEQNKIEYIPADSKENKPIMDISNAKPTSLADNCKKIEENLEDLTLKDPLAIKLHDNNASFFFDNIDRKELNEHMSEEDITDLKMCETCREVNSADSSKTDLTSQMIQNITAPIQLSNPVEVPLTEIDTPVLDNLLFVSNTRAEISQVKEDTMEAFKVKLATELLDRKDTEKFEQRPEIAEITNYGWCDQTVTVDREYDLADPNIQNITAIQDYAFHTDPNAIGFIGNNSLFFDDIPNNASDEIKAEFKNAQDEPTILTRQMSIPTAPEEEDLDNIGLNVQLIEQDAKRDFPDFEEFVIEPSETDDDKVKERERSGSDEELNVTDTFTNRVERFKKLEDSVEPTVSNVLFEIQSSTSPSMPIASYFDTGNYAAETHYRNSLTSPSSINAMNLGAQNRADTQDTSSHRPLFPDVDNSIYKIPDVGTQTPVVTTTNTSDVCSDTRITSAFKPTFCLPKRSFIPPPSAKETLPYDLFAKQSVPQEKVFDSKPAQTFAQVKKESASKPQEIFQSNVAETVTDPMNFFATEKSDKTTEDAGTNRLASYFATPAKASDNTKSFFELSQGQDHLKNWEATQSYKSFFEENEAGVDEQQPDTALRKQEHPKKQPRQSLGRDEQECTNPHQNWESTQSFKSYFDTDDDRDTTNEESNRNKTLHEITHSQNVTYTPEQYRANLKLIKDLTSSSNFHPTEDQVVKTVNYNSIIYTNRPFKLDSSTGEQTPKNCDEKFNFNEKSESLYVKTNVEETPVPDNSKVEMLVNKCKFCCNLDSGRVVILKDADLVNTKVRKAMESNASEGKHEANMSLEKTSNVIPNDPLLVQSSFALKCEDNQDDNATEADSRTSTEYSPVRHHWFYRVDAEGKSIWRGFSVTDNRALEDAFTSPDLDEGTVVPTDGGRFDVNVVGRLRVAVYWVDKPTNVRRCSWFYKGTTDARYVPYTEAVAAKLEEEYRHGVSTGEWHRRLVLPNNEAVVMHGPAVMVHFLQSSAADAWSGGAFFQFGKCVYRNPPKIRVAKDQNQKIDHLLLLVHGAGEWKNQREKIQSTMRPRVVRRGFDEAEIEDSEPSSIDHLLLLCHGVGSACDMRFRSVDEVVDDFRATSLQLIQSHYRSSYDDGVVGRVEVLPVSWHSTLHSGESGVDRRLARITLDSIPRLRSFTNDTVLDVLFYTSPVFCQTIIDEVCKELNRIYALFKQRNPTFEGEVSLGGHSLGSVILYDLLCHQQPEGPTAASSSNKAAKVVTGSAGTGQPTVRYPTLHFTPQALYALGSPIAIFECIRGVDCLGEQFALPNCKNFFNIFHPYDPIAYRIEPLINPQLKNVSPFLIPHHKGRKRMHLELKETVARVGADLKAKLLESIKTTWSSMWRAHPPPPELEKVVEEQLEKEALDEEPAEVEDRPLDADTSKLLGRLNAGRRVDYVLQEAPIEMINEYLFAMSSHVCYWESEDTMLLMLREIYDALRVQPDCCLPQQTMAVQRTRALEKEDILASAEMASSSEVQLEKS